MNHAVEVEQALLRRFGCWRALCGCRRVVEAERHPVKRPLRCGQARRRWPLRAGVEPIVWSGNHDGGGKPSGVVHVPNNISRKWSG